MATTEQINDISDYAKSLGAKGIRILNEGHFDYGKLAPGDTELTSSKFWENESPTEEDLPGVSCLHAGYHLPSGYSYHGDEIVILDNLRGGWEEGQDEGEIILPNPVVVEVVRLDDAPAQKVGRMKMGLSDKAFSRISQTVQDPLKLLKSLRKQIVTQAQPILDAWEQDEEGFDEEFGGGGACDAIAQEIAGILAENGFDITEGGQDGDDHAFNVALKDGRAFVVDIPAGVYESGGGYSWKKLQDVQLDPNDVEIIELYNVSDYDYEGIYEGVEGEDY